jgi:hypothetical protein
MIKVDIKVKNNKYLEIEEVLFRKPDISLGWFDPI